MAEVVALSRGSLGCGHGPGLGSQVHPWKSPSGLDTRPVQLKGSGLSGSKTVRYLVIPSRQRPVGQPTWVQTSLLGPPGRRRLPGDRGPLLRGELLGPRPAPLESAPAAEGHGGRVLPIRVWRRRRGFVRGIVDDGRKRLAPTVRGRTPTPAPLPLAGPSAPIPGDRYWTGPPAPRQRMERDVSADEDHSSRSRSARSCCRRSLRSHRR